MLDDNNRIIYKPAQYEAIKELVDKRIADGSLHPDVLNKRLAEFGLSIQSTDFTTKLQNITELSKIRSTLLQDIVDRLYTDILTLYKSIEQAENTYVFKNRKIQQELSNSKDNYLKVKSDVKAFINGYKHPEYDEVRFINFYDKNNYVTGENDLAMITSKGNKLKLNGSQTLISSLTDIKASFNIEANMYTVEGNVNSIVDNNPNTYWQTTVLSETLVDNFKCNVVISTNTVQKVSSISILPSCPYPQVVSNIEYSLDGITWKTVPDFEPSLATQNTDYVVFDFGTIEAKFFKVELTQFNSIYRDKLIPESVNNSDIDTISGRLANNISMIDFSNSESRSEEIVQNISQAIINSAIFDSNVLTRVNGYEYVFGLSEIVLSFSDNFLTGFYSSKPFSNLKNAFLIQVLANDKSSNKTSIEYNIDIGDNTRIPILPIGRDNFVENELLELNGDDLTAQTRFTIDIDKGVSVYRNGVEMPSNRFVFSSNSVSLLNSSYGEPIDNSSVYTIAYFSVKGDEINLLEQLNSKPFEESFNGTDGRYGIELTYYPFIEYGVINDFKNFYYDNGDYIYSGPPNTILAFATNNPFERMQIPENLVNAILQILYLDGIPYGSTASSQKVYSPISIYIDGVKARNITNYIGDEQPALSKNPIGQTNYEYIQRGNFITFGTDIVGKNIVVKYNVLAKQIAVNVVLRQTTIGDNSNTPVVKDITLLIKARHK